MTKSFRATMTEALQTWKRDGRDAVSALRQAEIACGRANEDFSVGGRALVEEVYGGKFTNTMTGVSFAENEA